MRSFRVVMAGLIAICILPFVSVMLAYALTDFGHCRLDEGGIYPCLIAGVGLGAVLSAMSIVGWLGIATAPLLLIVLLVWAVVEFVPRRRRRST